MIKQQLDRRILVLDGAMGTMIQKRGLDEHDFCGTQFENWPCRLKGCNDVLVLTRPDVIADIHSQYLKAGADVISTDSFNANGFSLGDYELGGYVRQINLEAARLARRVADGFSAADGNRRWVAGSVGPTGKSLTMAADENISWDSLVATYVDQMSALIEGGVDLLLIETIFDTLNAKAAVSAAQVAMEQQGRQVPLMLSVTLTESGRTLSGQTLEAFVASIMHANPLAISLNCGFGIDQLVPYIEALQRFPVAVGVYPNAGLPNEMGEYGETPEMMASKMVKVLQSGRLNMVGGCCGTTPQHIEAIAREARNASPRQVPEHDGVMRLSGLEPMNIAPNHLFVNVGERCNVAGSRKFLRLIKEGSIDEAIDIARSQVENGAQIIDINMDDAMLDATTQMAQFVTRIGNEPDVARVPLMIDSSNWEAIVEALKHVQGKSIVNSISLKEGEDAFVAKAHHIKQSGAAVVVMAFDENGQADTYERKIEVCGRAYDILINKVGMAGEDIIFDPNVLAVATGIEAHDSYGLDFIRAVEWIKNNLPGAKVSGGISNLSFSFRGNNYVREAMHAVFLYHAIGKGMDMGIVNPSSLMSVEDIAPDLREALDDVLLNRRHDATERLVVMAERVKAEREGVAEEAIVAEKESLTASQRVEQMLVKGQSDGMERYLENVMTDKGSAMAVIDQVLMEGMNTVGMLFGQGKMFLPQVVKSAKVMKQAVAWLTPFIEQEKQSSGHLSAARIVIATVKGDVHDIGKNIVSVIMNCNGFEVIDMGVMVPGEEIVARAIETDAQFIGLSGLITPSLEEMCHVASLMQERQMNIPLLIGGATASALHTAVKIAPLYDGPVVYIRDAAAIPSMMQKLMSDSRQQIIAELMAEQDLLRRQYAQKSTKLSVVEARMRRQLYADEPIKPPFEGLKDMAFKVSEIRDLINWRAFFAVWKLDASFAQLTQIEGCDHCRAMWLASVAQEQRVKAAEAMQLHKEACRVLDALSDYEVKARVVFVPAGSKNESVVYSYNGVEYEIDAPRQRHREGEGFRLSLADFIKPVSEQGELTDWIALFAVTVGMELQSKIENFKADGDDYNTILYQALADRLAEAATEMMHRSVKRGDIEIRPAIGYPSLPDQRLVFVVEPAICYDQMGIELTENGAMYPLSSTTGLIICNRDCRYFSVD